MTALGLIAAALAVATILLEGCIGIGAAPAPTQLVRPYPDGCADFELSARRCAAVVAIAREQLDIEDPAARVELLSEAPDPACGPRGDGTVILCNRSGGHTAVIVRIRPTVGPAKSSVFFCGVGSQGSIACNENPVITIATPMEGYRDIACAGEDANGTPTDCATPVPAIEPEARAAGRPLSIAALDIPLDRTGPYAVELGTVGIPNGVLQMASAKLAGETLPNAVFLDGIRLTVEPVNPGGKPFTNRYEHGWVAGVEDAKVMLHFHIVQHDPGAVLQVRDIAVG